MSERIFLVKLFGFYIVLNFSIKFYDANVVHAQYTELFEKSDLYSFLMNVLTGSSFLLIRLSIKGRDRIN